MSINAISVRVKDRSGYKVNVSENKINSLSDLLDVNLENPKANQSLFYNENIHKFENRYIEPNIVLKISSNTSLGGQRCIAVINNSPLYANSLNLNHIFPQKGISKFSVEPGSELEIITSGIAEDVSWNWVPGNPIYFNNNGVLTQNIPNEGFIQQIGIAISNTIINISISQPIKL